MIIVKDAMVLIHLAKTTLLETSCDYFGSITIPPLVKEEVTNPKYPDAQIINALIAKNKIKVSQISDKKLIKKANEFNIQRGEAEAVALYWELNADLIATDDDNVRKKKDILQLNLIGTPAIMLKLYIGKRIRKNKLDDAMKKLREIGWFSNTIWDKIQLEVEKSA